MRKGSRDFSQQGFFQKCHFHLHIHILLARIMFMSTAIPTCIEHVDIQSLSERKARDQGLEGQIVKATLSTHHKWISFFHFLLFFFFAF